MLLVFLHAIIEMGKQPSEPRILLRFNMRAVEFSCYMLQNHDPVPAPTYVYNIALALDTTVSTWVLNVAISKRHSPVLET